MPALIFHSTNFRDNIPAYAARLSAPEPEVAKAYDALLTADLANERDGTLEQGRVTYISYIDLSEGIADPLERRLYKTMLSDLACEPQPKFGINYATFRNRMLRVWELLYNIFICKIPFHVVRITWLRMGGAKIGKGSSIWRNTEVIGVENLRIGDDSVVAWHCQLDARAGLIIGNHVTLASYTLVIAGGHDYASPSFDPMGQTIYIDDYAWIASRAMISAGAHIGEGAIVTGGTIVSKPVKPYKIVGGLSAKPLGDRPRGLSYRVGGRSLFTFLH